MRHIGLSTTSAQSFPVSGIALSELKEVVFATSARLDREGAQASIAEKAALDILKLAHLLPAAITVPLADGLIAEGLISIDAEMLNNYHDRIAASIDIVSRTRIPLGDCEDAEFVLFHGSDGLREQVAVVVGSPSSDNPTFVRVHSACLTGDLFGSLKCDCGDQLRGSIESLATLGGGVLLYLDQEGRGIGLRNKMRAYNLQENDHDTIDADAILGYEPDERRYGIAARMLTLLGFQRIILLSNNPEKAEALSCYGIDVVGSKQLLGKVNKHNLHYLKTKANRGGHTLGHLVGGGREPQTPSPASNPCRESVRTD
ncbi:MAG: GTP cyclohydrolase II RibA [Rhodospirillales bacterium]|nr:GTP cyclohydrolase II RibA [Rhodospirillales bacterium]